MLNNGFLRLYKIADKKEDIVRERRNQMNNKPNLLRFVSEYKKGWWKKRSNKYE